MSRHADDWHTEHNLRITAETELAALRRRVAALADKWHAAELYGLSRMVRNLIEPENHHD